MANRDGGREHVQCLYYIWIKLSVSEADTDQLQVNIRLHNSILYIHFNIAIVTPCIDYNNEIGGEKSSHRCLWKNYVNNSWIASQTVTDNCVKWIAFDVCFHSKYTMTLQSMARASIEDILWLYTANIVYTLLHRVAIPDKSAARWSYAAR